MIAVLVAVLDAQIAQLTEELAFLQWSLVREPFEGGEALAVVGVLLDLHEEMENRWWSLREARNDLAWMVSL